MNSDYLLLDTITLLVIYFFFSLVQCYDQGFELVATCLVINYEIASKLGVAWIHESILE